MKRLDVRGEGDGGDRGSGEDGGGAHRNNKDSDYNKRRVRAGGLSRKERMDGSRDRDECSGF